MIPLLALALSYYIWDLAAPTPRDTLCLVILHPDGVEMAELKAMLQIP